MAYQLPNDLDGLFLLDETAIELYNIVPTKKILFKHLIIHLYFKGHLATDFKMRINVYAGDGSLLFRSTPVNNLDIARTSEHYLELRFDFPTLGNLLSLGKRHKVEFEVYDGYTYDASNHVAIIIEEMAAQNYLGSDQFDVADALVKSAKCSFFMSYPNASSEEFYLAKIGGGKLLNGIVTRTEYQFFPTICHYAATIQTGLHIEDLYINYVNFGSNEFIHLLPASGPFTVDPMNLNLNKNKYYYDPTTGEFYFYYEDPNGYINTTNYAMLEYSIFMTNDVGRYAPPELGNSGSVYYQPRLPDSVNFDFSQENNRQGLFSISSSPLALKNHDGFFNPFFSEHDCFNNRSVKIWKCKGTIEDYSVEFSGVVKSAYLTDQVCNFSLADAFVRLDNTFDDGLPLNLYDLSVLGGYTIAIRDVDKVVPRVMGKISSFALLTKFTGQALDINWYDPSKMIQANCVSFSSALSTSANRDWTLGFGPSSASTQSRTVSAAANYTSGTFLATQLTINNSAGPVNEWLPPGTCIVNNSQYGIVYASDATRAWVWPRNTSMSTANVTRHKITSVVIDRDGVLFYPLSGRDYTAKIGAAGDIQIDFVNNFEANVSLGSALDPASDLVYGVFMNDDYDSKASFITESLLDTAGFDNLATDFAPDQTVAWTDIELALTIPNPGDNSMPTYRDLIEKCLRSAMSFLYLGTDGDFRYKSFLHPIENPLFATVNESGFDPAIPLNQTNSSEFSVEFDLWDLCGGVNFNFIHCKRFSSALYQYPMVKALYGTNKIYEVDTVIDPVRDAAATFMLDYVKLMTGRTAVFSLTAYSDHLDMWVGDDVKVERRRLVGDENSFTMRVISQNKQIKRTEMRLMDLKRFPTL